MTMESWHRRLPDVTLRCEARGDAPSTVFLHGFGGSMEDWRPIWDRIDPALSILRYDQRGFGQSRAHGDNAFSHADDLLRLLDAQGIACADLIGISMGGSIATHFALNHPDRVRRLVLISPGLMAWDWSEEWRMVWRAITDAARAGDLGRARALWYDHPMFATVRADPAMAIWLKASIDRYACVQWIADRQHAMMPDVERLPMLLTPTLLLTGEHDLPDFRLIADLIMGSAANVERIDLTGCGHMLTMEAPAACAEAIGDFLRRE